MADRNRLLVGESDPETVTVSSPDSAWTAFERANTPATHGKEKGALQEVGNEMMLEEELDEFGEDHREADPTRMVSRGP